MESRAWRRYGADTAHQSEGAAWDEPVGRRGGDTFPGPLRSAASYTILRTERTKLWNALDAEDTWQRNHQTIFIIRKVGGDALIAEHARPTILVAPVDL